MTVAEIIKPGDKVDIALAQEVERFSENHEFPETHKSQVLDLKENGNIEISMPSKRGRLVLLPLGVRLEFVFFSNGGLYRAIGQIKERYKSENVYMLEIELRSQLEKYQRREFFRYPCVLDMNYYMITSQEAEQVPGEALFIQIREAEEEGQREECKGQIVDLSGGGIRFRTKNDLGEQTHVLLEVNLKNESVDKQYYIIGNIISCERTGETSEREYEVRAKFIIEDNSIREEIIRFIFEEERKTRQRGRW